MTMAEIAASTVDDALTYELEIAAPPSIVWRFWVDPERLVRWMGKVATLDPRPGGEMRLDYGQGDVASGRYVELDEPHRLVFTWGWEAAGDAVPSGASRVEVDLEPVNDGAGTLLRLRHLGLPAESQSSHDDGWKYFLGRLTDAVAQPG